ncbi:uroporphyrinogen-III C-methyltransferase [Piscinibacter sp. XHJ-5]|uniref:uroporphyrinogen-III C-methyltransferase n=1 Tax=Piscinibacter sp. XHJ-5 TaxID=3037797 RepID=UPI003297B688
MSQPPIEVLPAPAVPAAPSAEMPVPRRWWWAGAGLLLAIALLALIVAWMAQQRIKLLQQELVRRQQDSGSQAVEARTLAKQASDGMRDNAAKIALLEARVAEVAIQRSQLEDLIQSLSRSRDENVVVDIDAAIRVALQQTAITGTAEPLVSALKQADERLARYNQPRLEGVRRAIARDLDRVKAVGVTDLPTLSIRLDEAVRLVDELPLLSVVEPRKPASSPLSRQAQRSAPVAPEASAAAWASVLDTTWREFTDRVWSEVRSLVRVTRIDHPEAMLLVPEQAYFVRENLKLRLLNARLALLARQYDAAQADLQVAQSALDRYFDRGSRRHALATDLVRQVATQARHVGVPRPDDTLAALSAASAGR